jgi:hypothetical protein
MVNQITRHQPALRARNLIQWIARNAEGWKERLRHQPHRSRDVEHPSGAILFGLALFGATDTEIIADAVSEEGDLEDLEI